jgi:DNA-binding CsgD family transcriptional regulator
MRAGDELSIDMAYEAAVVPEMWPQLLDALSGSVGVAGGIVFVANQSSVSWLASEALQGFMADFIAEGWDKRNGRGDRVAAGRYDRFVHDLDIFTPAEIERDPSYRDFYWPRGFGWGAGTQVKLPSGDLFTISFERHLADGPMGRADLILLDQLRPHLARASMLSARLQLDRMRTAADTLASLGFPAAALRLDGRVLAANSLMAEMSQYIRIGAFDRMRLQDKSADKMLESAVANLQASASGVLSVPLRPRDADAMVLHLIPIRRRAHDIFANACCLAIVTPVAAPQPPPDALLNDLFDLTPAEARVARFLAQGENVTTIAAMLGTKPATVRDQLKHVLAKTGTHRQSSLIGLLAGISLERGAGTLG